MESDNENPPSTAAGNGRGAGGKFTAGNRLGRGNPNNIRAQKLRNAFLKAITAKDVKEIAAAVLNAAKGGDIVACRELLDRTLGKPVQMDLLERIEALESAAKVQPQKPEKRWN